MKTEAFKLSQWGQRGIMDFAGKPGLVRSYAIEIVDQLNKEPLSPWYGRIRFVGERALRRQRRER